MIDEDKEEVDDDGKALPLAGPVRIRQGHDVTLVSWGAMMLETLRAADILSDQGISAEVIDLCVLNPLQPAEILSSVSKTGRCVIVHEAPLTGGFGAEIAARLADEGLMSLVAPVRRVTGPDTVMPYPRLEQSYMPGTEQIVNAVDECLSYS